MVIQVEAARLLIFRAAEHAGTGAPVRARGLAGEVLLQRDGQAGLRPRDPAARRLRLLGRVRASSACTATPTAGRSPAARRRCSGCGSRRSTWAGASASARSGAAHPTRRGPRRGAAGAAGQDADGARRAAAQRVQDARAPPAAAAARERARRLLHGPRRDPRPRARARDPARRRPRRLRVRDRPAPLDRGEGRADAPRRSTPPWTPRASSRSATTSSRCSRWRTSWPRPTPSRTRCGSGSARRWSDDERLELLVLAGFYRLLAGVLNGAGVELDDAVT